MKPIYRVIAAFLIGPVLFMSVAFTMFKTECLHTGEVRWEMYEAVECLSDLEPALRQAQGDADEHAHACCHEKKECKHEPKEGSENLKKKCCTNTMVNGYMEVESVMDDVSDIKPVSFELIWAPVNPVIASVSTPVGFNYTTRPPPKSIADQLASLQVYRL